MSGPLASPNLTRLAHLDIPGGGQIVASGHHIYVGHMKPPHGTSIVDVSDPRRPRLECTLEVDSPYSHTHKVRVVDDIMITNVEQDRRHLLRKGYALSQLSTDMAGRLGREPRVDELAAALNVAPSDIGDIRSFLSRGYEEGGFKVWDVSDKARPRLLSYQRTYGVGVHRFDMDGCYAYISTEMEGYHGNILVIFDISRPDRIDEVSRWWIPGQHVAAGEVPDWAGVSHRLHHALRVGEELWAAVWHAGFRVIDISDLTTPKTVAGYDYHPWVVEPTHTVLPAAHRRDGRRVAVVCDEEHEHRRGQPHAGLWFFDVTDFGDVRPLSTFHVSEMDSPWARAPGRFGMHQFRERIDNDFVFCAWFSGGLRVVDMADPAQPREAGFFIPEPVKGNASPQTNDVDLDDRGLVYLIDRNAGLDILEFRS